MNLGSNEILNDFPSGKKIYLNNASVSLTPLISIRAMTDFMVSYNAMGPDSIDSESFINEKLRNIRVSISKLLKCQPNEIILTQSTTDGINIVANGISHDSNSNIIIRGMEHEHHSNYYPWLKLSQKLELRSLQIDNNGFFKNEELKQKIDKNTKLIALSHALYNTGAILPINEIGEIIKKNNALYFLDAAQTIGCIGDFDVNSTNCDFMSFNGSKWLCGPMGTGLFYCKKSSSEFLKPINIGGESAMIFDDTKLAYKDLPEKFQTGFRNYVGFVGLEESINYMSKFGFDNIRKKIIKLANLMRDELSKISEIELYGPENPDQRTSIVSFTIEGKKSNDIITKLEKQKIILAEREIMDKKILRASPHFFNSETEIMKVIDVIKKL